MKKRSLVLFTLIALLSFTSETYSQGFLKKLGKALEEVNKTLEEVNSAVGGTTTSLATDNTESAATDDSSNQKKGSSATVTTNHPDFKIKVSRCEVSGRTCVVDLILENKGSSDVAMTIIANGAVAYDDQANEYTDVKISIGSSDWVTGGRDYKLRSEVPVKARIQIENVVDEATIFKRLDWHINCNEWDLHHNKTIKFKNLTISRADDSAE